MPNYKMQDPLANDVTTTPATFINGNFLHRCKCLESWLDGLSQRTSFRQYHRVGLDGDEKGKKISRLQTRMKEALENAVWKLL